MSDMEERKREFLKMLDEQKGNPGKFPLPESSETELVKELNQRVWNCKNPNNAIQFRNCVTDMYMLGIIGIFEYINISDNIDRFINYNLSYRTMDTF